MKQKELLKRIEELEKKVRELEARPPIVITIPQPIYTPIPSPYIQPLSPFIPYSPTTTPGTWQPQTLPWTTC